MELTHPCPNGHIMTLQKINLHFERGGFAADVQDVRAYVCPECGVRLIPGSIAEQVSETTEALFAAALHTEVSEALAPYSRLVFQRVSV